MLLEYLEKHRGPLPPGIEMEWCPLRQISSSPKGVYFHPQVLTLRMQLSLPDFIHQVLSFYNIAPTQLTLGVWRTILVTNPPVSISLLSCTISRILPLFTRYENFRLGFIASLRGEAGRYYSLTSRIMTMGGTALSVEWSWKRSESLEYGRRYSGQ